MSLQKSLLDARGHERPAVAAPSRARTTRGAERAEQRASAGESWDAAVWRASGLDETREAVLGLARDVRESGVDRSQESLAMERQHRLRPDHADTWPELAFAELMAANSNVHFRVSRQGVADATPHAEGSAKPSYPTTCCRGVTGDKSSRQCDGRWATPALVFLLACFGAQLALTWLFVLHPLFLDPARGPWQLWCSGKFAGVRTPQTHFALEGEGIVQTAANLSAAEARHPEVVPRCVVAVGVFASGIVAIGQVRACAAAT